MNETNRSLIVLFCGLLIMLMSIVIFITWSASTDAIDALFDGVEYLQDNNDDAGRLIVTLLALMIAVAALLVIIVELAPEEEEKELKVQQAGATTIVPARALRERLEEALLTVPEITSARARVKTRERGIGAQLDITVTPHANIARATQESTRVVIDTVQEDLGLPLHGTPVVRVAFGGEKPQPVASSITQPPTPPQRPESPEPLTERAPDYSQFQRPSAPPESPRESPYSPATQPPGEGERSEGTVDTTSEGGETDDRPQP